MKFRIFAVALIRRAGALPVKVWALMLVLAPALSNPAIAAEKTPHPAGQLTAQALVADVLRSNPHVAALRHALASAHARVGPAGALDDPILTYALAPASLGAEGLDPGHIIALAQPLPWPGKRAARKQRAASTAQAVDAGLETAQRDAAWFARALFADWVHLHRALDINLSQQRLLGDLVASTRGQYVGGDGGQHAVLAANLKRAQRQRAQIDLEAQRQALAAQINALRNVAPQIPLAAPAALPQLASLPSLEHLQQQLRAGHPELRQMNARIRAAEAAQRLAKLNDWPDLQLTATWLGTLPRDENRAQVGIKLNLPFGRDKRQDAQFAAASDIAELQAMRAQTLARLQAELQTVLAKAKAADATVQLYREQLLPLAEQSLQTAQTEYAAGNGSVREVIEAENDLLEARLGASAAQSDRFKQYARIAWMSGTPPNHALFLENLHTAEVHP